MSRKLSLLTGDFNFKMEVVKHQIIKQSRSVFSICRCVDLLLSYSRRHASCVWMSVFFFLLSVSVSNSRYAQSALDVEISQATKRLRQNPQRLNIFIHLPLEVQWGSSEMCSIVAFANGSFSEVCLIEPSEALKRRKESLKGQRTWECRNIFRMDLLHESQKAFWTESSKKT